MRPVRGPKGTGRVARTWVKDIAAAECDAQQCIGNPILLCLGSKKNGGAISAVARRRQRVRPLNACSRFRCNLPSTKLFQYITTQCVVFLYPCFCLESSQRHFLRPTKPGFSCDWDCGIAEEWNASYGSRTGSSRHDARRGQTSAFVLYQWHA